MITKKCTTLLIAYSSGKNSHHNHKQKMTMYLLNSSQKYFKDKIDTIMLQLQLTEAGQTNPKYIESQHKIEHRMQSFMPVSSNDIYFSNFILTSKAL